MHWNFSIPALRKKDAHCKRYLRMSNSSHVANQWGALYWWPWSVRVWIVISRPTNHVAVTCGTPRTRNSLTTRLAFWGRLSHGSNSIRYANTHRKDYFFLTCFSDFCHSLFTLVQQRQVFSYCKQDWRSFVNVASKSLTWMPWIQFAFFQMLWTTGTLTFWRLRVESWRSLWRCSSGRRMAFSCAMTLSSSLSTIEALTTALVTKRWNGSHLLDRWHSIIPISSPSTPKWLKFDTWKP